MEEPRSEPPASIPVRDQASPVSGLVGADDGASLAALPPSRKSSFRSKIREPITAENFREQVNETMALAEALSRVKSKRRAPNGYFSPAVDKFAAGTDIVKDDASSTSSSTTDLGHIARHFMTSDVKEMANATDGIRDSIATFDEDEVTLATATQVRARDLTLRDQIATSSPPASDDSFEDVFVLTDSQENSDEDDEEDNRRRSMVVEPRSDGTCEHKEGNGWSASSDVFEDDSDRSSSGDSNSSFQTVDMTPPTEPE
ncbi:hypothetical protein PFICI_15301 [Pestalotiopsis fici W106-1]|uniref:Uncharacterized protein n=1 Tax=Pestalotiopsis fici (strain W106-1 / CGMCC3.15140) TaxID=1229662 RepID=W3WGH7_PESFW|nr:uncharacterized protein PFICI_15301 [Pestalotiopsis fici W106-1]ETS72909.1 hypothetical protein PFICI_15301 [Pestalotiopsis fici W106-1]